MSSFVGHSLAAFFISSFHRERSGSTPYKVVWVGWLIALASAPDLDYIIPSLATPARGGLRITHSVTFSLFLPLCTAAVLFLKSSRKRFKVLSIQAVLAGLSHLLLDLLVGVTPLPLFWPLSAAAFKLPFGVLPSAGRIDVSNYYFYRNLMIEVGILVPLFYSAYDLCGGQTRVGNKLRAVVLLLISVCFIVWSLGLRR
ncbi:MAG TPA: metal-dependent hydrolase [Pyrinomonadaceae bacterium]|nr:metal-dependent hydrolase [Pyrinomonadaceae bacterium]